MPPPKGTTLLKHYKPYIYDKAAAGAEVSRRGVQQTEGGRFLVKSTSDDAAIFLQPSYCVHKSEGL